jgi:HNH/Endo VII superfamily nuclease toxins/Pretoxin HINT domain
VPQDLDGGPCPERVVLFSGQVSLFPTAGFRGPGPAGGSAWPGPAQRLPAGGEQRAGWDAAPVSGRGSIINVSTVGNPGAEEPCGNSFAAATPVLLASGKAVPISQLKAGDKVLADDTKTGKDQPEAVTAVMVHHDTDLYDLTVKTSGGTQVIHTTSNHLFWDPYLNKWVPASNFKPGEHPKTPNGQAAVVVGGSTPAVHDGWMWDLTVPGNNDHDFYVIAEAVDTGDRAYHVGVGDTPVLVHNCGGDAPPNMSPEEARRQGAFNQAKRDSGIPTSQSPDRTLPNVDRRGNPQPGYIYEFDVPAPGGGTRTVIIRDDAGGHTFPDDPTQDRGPHFNTENGDHYDY